MSVRRLADDSVQPSSFSFSKENLAWAKKRIALYPKGREQSAIIPLLMRAQEQNGWVSKAAIEKCADMVNMPYIRALEVATFYTQFQLQPVGSKAHIQICGTTPCMLRGAEDLRALCQRKIAKKAHQLNEDGTLSWEEVECAGACVNAPIVTIGKDTYEDLTVERLEEIIDAFIAGKAAQITPGPQIDRQFSAPANGFTSLLNMNGKEKKSPANSKGKKGKNRVKSVNENKQAALFSAPKNKKDDLKLISGIGAVLEKKLNNLGITTFAQLAALKKADIKKIDDALSFKGRIERDEWIKQAKALAKGGVEEYIRQFGKKPV